MASLREELIQERTIFSGVLLGCMVQCRAQSGVCSWRSWRVLRFARMFRGILGYRARCGAFVLSSTIYSRLIYCYRGSFTWSNGHNLSRIDRFLVTGGWEEHFPKVMQLRFPCPISDHCPSFLIVGGFVVALLYFDLRTCGCEWMASWNGQKAEVVSLLHSLDELEAQRDLSGDDVAQRAAKSHCLWLNDGDHNTNFFHRMANAHRRANQISRLRVDGRELCSDVEIKKGVVGF
ncbi:hypothetical protein ACSBR1_024562 [Camellia fascicularis]